MVVAVAVVCHLVVDVDQVVVALHDVDNLVRASPCRRQAARTCVAARGTKRSRRRITGARARAVAAAARAATRSRAAATKRAGSASAQRLGGGGLPSSSPSPMPPGRARAGPPLGVGTRAPTVWAVPPTARPRAGRAGPPGEAPSPSGRSRPRSHTQPCHAKGRARPAAHRAAWSSPVIRWINTFGHWSASAEYGISVMSPSSSYLCTCRGARHKEVTTTRCGGASARCGGSHARFNAVARAASKRARALQRSADRLDRAARRATSGRSSWAVW